MSNQSLITRIRQKLTAFGKNEASCAELAYTLRHEGKALEALPFDLHRQVEGLAQDFEAAQWAIDEGCLPDIASLIARTEILLEKISALSTSR